MLTGCTTLVPIAGSDVWRCWVHTSGSALGPEKSTQDEINAWPPQLDDDSKFLLMGNGWTSPFPSINKLLFRVPGWYLHTFWKYKMLLYTAWWFVSNPFEKCAQVKLDHFPVLQG